MPTRITVTRSLTHGESTDEKDATSTISEEVLSPTSSAEPVEADAGEGAEVHSWHNKAEKEKEETENNSVNDGDEGQRAKTEYTSYPPAFFQAAMKNSDVASEEKETTQAEEDEEVNENSELGALKKVRTIIYKCGTVLHHMHTYSYFREHPAAA